MPAFTESPRGEALSIRSSDVVWGRPPDQVAPCTDRVPPYRLARRTSTGPRWPTPGRSGREAIGTGRPHAGTVTSRTEQAKPGRDP